MTLSLNSNIVSCPNGFILKFFSSTYSGYYFILTPDLFVFLSTWSVRKPYQVNPQGHREIVRKLSISPLIGGDEVLNQNHF